MEAAFYQFCVWLAIAFIMISGVYLAVNAIVDRWKALMNAPTDFIKEVFSWPSPFAKVVDSETVRYTEEKLLEVPSMPDIADIVQGVFKFLTNIENEGPYISLEVASFKDKIAQLVNQAGITLEHLSGVQPASAPESAPAVTPQTE